ncbi:RNA-binding protein [Phanerochaete sordida]|uniref:RNA-binding protein n=1 Tax=Phanerochaete sordida TaxID=48140 RepID=A0A9P3GDY2_9APHY|nr:RNA-binding protein [Phanerochaete sordida]
MITTALWNGCWYPAGTVSLKTYDPCTIIVTNLLLDTTIENMHTNFDKFGPIVEVRMVERPAAGDTVSAIVTFSTEEAAKLARARMSLQVLNGRRIFVNFVEYGSRGHPSPPSAHSSWREEPRKFTKAEFAGDDGRARKEETAKRKVAEAETAEAAAIAETAAATRALTSAEDILERASRLSDQREEEVVASEAKTRAANEALRRAERAVDEAQCAARAARVHANLMDEGFQAATLRAELACSAFKAAHVNVVSADNRVDRAKTSEEAAKLRTKAAKDVAARLSGASGGGAPAKEGARDDLQESIRRMQELRAQEEEDRHQRETTGPDDEEQASNQPRAGKEQRREEDRHAKESAANAEEVRRREEEEEERKAAEQRQKADAARCEAEAMQKAYDDAVRAETERCRRRDDDICSGVRSWWPATFALQRFELVSSEFDAIQFSERQPLTAGSVPWPTLLCPSKLDVADITWDMVDAFFEEVRSALAASEYRRLVEKTHRRFHPDKWRSRRLLVSVRDEDLRKRLESAGNIVAQAMTPLWRKSQGVLDSDEGWW